MVPVIGRFKKLRFEKLSVGEIVILLKLIFYFREFQLGDNE